MDTVTEADMAIAMAVSLLPGWVGTGQEWAVQHRRG